MEKKKKKELVLFVVMWAVIMAFIYVIALANYYANESSIKQSGGDIPLAIDIFLKIYYLEPLGVGLMVGLGFVLALLVRR